MPMFPRQNWGNQGPPAWCPEALAKAAPKDRGQGSALAIFRYSLFAQNLTLPLIPRGSGVYCWCKRSCLIKASISFQGQHFPPAVKRCSHSLGLPFQNQFVYQCQKKTFDDPLHNALQNYNTGKLSYGHAFWACFSKKAFCSFYLLAMERSTVCSFVGVLSSVTGFMLVGLS